MRTIISTILSKESIWYPACGFDLRPIHHIAFNNTYISPKVLIFNDILDELDISAITPKIGCTLIANNINTLNGITVRCLKIKFSHESKNKIIDLFYFICSNQRMLEFLEQYEIQPSTLLLNQTHDDSEFMRKSWLEAIGSLNIRYCYTDNISLLSFHHNSSFRAQLRKNSLRYIGTQTYFGIGISSKFMSEEPYDALSRINQEHSLHLFEIQ
jgi:hypothetical protein